MVETSDPTRTRHGRQARGAPRSRWPLIAVGLAAVGLAVAACGSSSSPSTASNAAPSANQAQSSAVLSSATSPLGSILVDSQGRTVYMFAADTPGHSACTGSCLTYWPLVPAPATVPTKVSGVSAKIGAITRADGTRQLTVNGWPVYTYAADTSPGMTSGQGVNASGGLWWVLSPAGAVIKATGTSSTPSQSSSSSASTSGGGGWG